MVNMATWTNDEAQQAKLLRSEGYNWKVVARKMGREDDRYWRNAVRRYDERCQRKPEIAAYRDGLEACRAGLPRDPPDKYELMTNAWAHWLAGWNDWNMRVN